MLVLGYELSYLELFGSIVSLIAVLFATRAKIWNWPIGIVGQILFFFLFLKNGLFGQMVLQTFFTGVSIYGWYYWDRDAGKKIKTIGLKNIISYSLITAFLCLIGTFILSFFQTEYVILDATITVISMVAVFGLSKKYLEAWVLWIIVDILSIALFYLKGINLISIEYILITAIATYGLVNWTKTYKNQI